jgi:hypothetical protein
MRANARIPVFGDFFNFRLHFFMHNPTAVELCKKVGCEITSMNMVKHLAD